MVMVGAIQTGRLGIPLVFLLGALMTIVCLFRIFHLVFMGQPHRPPPKEGSPVMVTSAATLAALSVMAGLAINWPVGFAEYAAQQMLGVLQ